MPDPGRRQPLIHSARAAEALTSCNCPQEGVAACHRSGQTRLGVDHANSSSLPPCLRSAKLALQRMCTVFISTTSSEESE